MEYLTSQAHYPGALSLNAVALLKCISIEGVWYPHWIEMRRSELDAFAELVRAAYIESVAWFGYRAKGRSPLPRIDMANILQVIAAVAANETLSVDIVRITHNVRSVQVTCMGQIVAEKLVMGSERKPALDTLFRWQKMLGLQGGGE